MGKNIKGGKKGRRGKNDIEERFFETKEEGQCYALVTQYYGNGRVEVNCFLEVPKSDNIENNENPDTESNSNEKEFNISKKLGIIRGTMRKRKYKNNVTVGCVVIVGLRDFENDKCDIMHVYNNDEVRKLKKMGEIPNVAVEAGSTDIKQEDSVDFFEDEEEETEDNFNTSPQSSLEEDIENI
mgnify:CR=1 FL=1|tara:strand:+ start:174 stop:722 length:549 start_codon:yes stop_codon:yes gene_type:complete